LPGLPEHISETENANEVTGFSAAGMKAAEMQLASGSES
jgi:hypothetical protein